MTKPTTSEIVNFHKTLTKSYYEFGRHDMLWRLPEKDGHFDPYKILVSELMLQQTQVDRVAPKYELFIRHFPDVKTLSQATLGDVLKVWNGLGYNRRAKYIWQAAQTVMHDFDGQFPGTAQQLQKLSGVGPNTAGAIMAYAYGKPAVFLETNIRTVIIHHFFKDKSDISDAAIRDVLTQILPIRPDHYTARMQGAVLGPREFYWAMMDYGTYLKKTVGNLNRASKHYSKQSEFHGSLRQLRGRVIRELTAKPHSKTALHEMLDDDRLDAVLDALLREGMIARSGSTYRLS